jgi:hypothetical protein
VRILRLKDEDAHLQLMKDGNPLACPLLTGMHTAVDTTPNYLGRGPLGKDGSMPHELGGEIQGYSFTGMIKLVRAAPQNSEPLSAGDEYYVNDLGDMAGGDPVRDSWRQDITSDRVDAREGDLKVLKPMTTVQSNKQPGASDFFECALNSEVLDAVLDRKGRVNPYNTRLVFPNWEEEFLEEGEEGEGEGEPPETLAQKYGVTVETVRALQNFCAHFQESPTGYGRK